MLCPPWQVFRSQGDPVYTKHRLAVQYQQDTRQNRSLWKTEPERLLPGHDGSSNIVYDEAGTLYCYDKVSEPPVRHQMAYIGHEPERGTLKYRCPAKHEDWQCPMSSICNAGKSYGKTVRIKQEEDLRRFPPIPRATKQFERLYKGRTAVERVNGRIKIYWGADGQHRRRSAFPCLPGSDHGRASRHGHGLGQLATAGRDSRHNEVVADCQNVAGRNGHGVTGRYAPDRSFPPLLSPPCRQITAQPPPADAFGVRFLLILSCCYGRDWV